MKWGVGGKNAQGHFGGRGIMNHLNCPEDPVPLDPVAKAEGEGEGEGGRKIAGGGGGWEGCWVGTPPLPLLRPWWWGQRGRWPGYGAGGAADSSPASCPS